MIFEFVNAGITADKRKILIVFCGCLLFLSSCSNAGFPANIYVSATPNLWDKILYVYPKHLSYLYANKDTMYFYPDHSLEIANNLHHHYTGRWDMTQKRHIKVQIPIKKDSIYHSEFWCRAGNLYRITYWIDCEGKDTTKHYALRKFTPLID